MSSSALLRSASAAVRPPSLHLAALVVLIVTVPGLICAAQVRAGHPEVSWGANLFYCLPAFWPWAAASPLVVWLARRWRLDRRPLAPALLVHALGCAAFVLVHIGFFALWRQVAAPYETFATSFAGELLRLRSSLYVHLGVIAYWAIVGVWYLFDTYRRLRDEELDSARLQTRLAEARFDALRLQLRPHFLFNALNTVSVLIDERPDAAQRVLLRLSDLLRQSVEADRSPVVPLQQEVDHVRSYLAIEQARYGDRLDVTIDVADDLIDYPVPHVLLQPLAENAVRHGLAPLESGGRVEISARRDANGSPGGLVLEVRDDGVGYVEGAGGRASGIGLENCAARLEHLYGPAARLEVVAGAGLPGTRVRVHIPSRAPEPAQVAP